MLKVFKIIKLIKPEHKITGGIIKESDYNEDIKSLKHCTITLQSYNNMTL